MTYVSQLEALLAYAEGHVANAKREAENWPLCGAYLARAMECGSCAIFMAWGEPYKATKKMHRHFEERLAPLLDSNVSSVVQWIWEYEGQGKPNNADQIVAVSEGIIKIFAGLATNDPPVAWQPRPITQSIGWNRLSPAEQSFLQAALAVGRQECPGVRIMLFGSRAAGRAGPDSDYDLLFIFPDAVPEGRYGYTIGEVVSFANGNGIELDIEKTSDAAWVNPLEVSQPLFDQIKGCHIEIPDP